MKNCLIVIDMQNDFISEALGSDEAKKIVSYVKARIEKAIKDGEDIYFTKDTHYDNYLDTKEGEFHLASIICIVNENGKLLIQKRSDNKKSDCISKDKAVDLAIEIREIKDCLK